MTIKRIRVIIECLSCSFRPYLDCKYCDNTRETEQEIDLDTLMFELAGRLRHHDYIHDHGE